MSMGSQSNCLSAGQDPAARVIVVGGGVSGCACAITLAQAGIPVLLLNSALDVVGLPAYGPDVWVGVDRRPEDPEGLWSSHCLAAVPSLLRSVWQRWSLVPEGAEQWALVDRRAVSLATKELVESLRLVDIRQGLVVDVREVAGGSVEVETVFGEVIAGSACVLAVGLALGGSIRLGDTTLPGGRYGEVAADRLKEALVARGAIITAVTRQVGARHAGPPQTVLSGFEAGVTVTRLVAPVLSGAQVTEELQSPSAGRKVPPAPHEHGACEPSLVTQGAFALVVEAGQGAQCGGPHAQPTGLFPDGAATGEWYLSPEAASSGLAADLPTVRPPHTISAFTLETSVCHPIPGMEGIWAAGQVTGAVTYSESLLSGSRVARMVAERARP